MPGCARSRGNIPVCIALASWLVLGMLVLTLITAKTHAQKVAKELDVQTGLVFLPGQVEKLYEDSDMGPEFRQRRQYVLDRCVKVRTSRPG